jgi:Zn-dependent peptidase ImmA (M78 family)
MNNHSIEKITSKIINDLGILTPRGINVEKIAKHLNVDVKAEDLDSDISGLFVIKNNKPYIRYNSTECENRKRFTIAHELGHFILHSDSKPLFVDEKIMYRNFDSSTGEIRKEREANAFAASLLMPRVFIQSAINSAPKNTNDIVSYLADKFKVSEQAMNFRLANLGYVGLY